MQTAVTGSYRRTRGCFFFHKAWAQYTTGRQCRIRTVAASYNLRVRIRCVVLLIVCLAACNRGAHEKDAIRQGVIDHLAQVQLNVATMTVEVTSVQLNGNQAQATVTFTPKGGSAAQSMSMQYQMEKKGDRWSVVGRKDAGPSPHGGGAMPPPVAPGMENPHGGGGPSAAPGMPGGMGKMPSPEDLPPAGQKK